MSRDAHPSFSVFGAPPAACNLETSNPSLSSELPTELQQRLAELLDDYLLRLEAGAPISKEQLIAENPDLAEPIQEYFGGLELLCDGVGALKASTDDSFEIPDKPIRQIGDYEIVREIGRGGMGIVYEANQSSLGRRVALKVLPFSALLDAKQVKRFENEAKATACLDHPNIVQVFEVGAERGVHFFAMQYIEGQSLRAAINELQDDHLASQEGSTHHWASQKTVRALSGSRSDSSKYFPSVARIGIEAAKALHAAHECNIVHRDIKPSNLLLDPSGKLWVADFGLAQVQTDNSFSKTGDIVGTLNYMSPEQAAGEKSLVDARADVYALGITLYELATLQHPFQDDNAGATLQKIEHGDYRRPRSVHSKIPLDLENVILKAMSVRREDRYQTANELAEDLQRFLDGEPTLAKELPVSQRIRRFAKRKRRALYIAAAFALVIAFSLFRLHISALEKQHANDNSNQSRDITLEMQRQSLLDLKYLDASNAVKTKLLRRMLKNNLDFLHSVPDDPALWLRIAETKAMNAQIDEYLNRPDMAIASYLEAADQTKRLLAKNGDEPDTVRLMARIRNNLGMLYLKQQRFKAAEQEFDDAIGHLEVASASDPALIVELATAWNNLGQLRAEAQQLDGAKHCYQQAITVALQQTRNALQTWEGAQPLEAAHINLSKLQMDTPEIAEQGIQKSLDVLANIPDEARTENANELDMNVARANAFVLWAECKTKLQQPRKAAQLLKNAIANLKQVVKVAPNWEFFQSSLVIAHNELGKTLAQLGRDADALSEIHTAKQLQQRILTAQTHAIHQNRLGSIHTNLAILQTRLGHTRDAADSFKTAQAFLLDAYQALPQNDLYRQALDENSSHWERFLITRDQPVEAARIALARAKLWKKQGARQFEIAKNLALACWKMKQLKLNRSSNYGQFLKSTVSTLKEAESCGFPVEQGIKTEPDFAGIRNEPTFVLLEEEISSHPDPTLATQ